MRQITTINIAIIPKKIIAKRMIVRFRLSLIIFSVVICVKLCYTEIKIGKGKIMQRVDFSTVMNIIIENCRENMHTTKNRETAYSQFDLLCDIFYDFYTENDDVRFDNSAVSRWIKGNRPIPAIVVNYYREEGADIIGDSFQENCLNLVFDKGTTILYGNNAQGKTNILEAIYLSATTKSHKGSKDREINRHAWSRTIYYEVFFKIKWNS